MVLIYILTTHGKYHFDVMLGSILAVDFRFVNISAAEFRLGSISAVHFRLEQENI